MGIEVMYIMSTKSRFTCSLVIGSIWIT